MTYGVNVRIQTGHSLARAGRYHGQGGRQQVLVTESSDQGHHAVRTPRGHEEEAYGYGSLLKNYIQNILG